MFSFLILVHKRFDEQRFCSISAVDFEQSIKKSYPKEVGTRHSKTINVDHITRTRVMLTKETSILVYLSPPFNILYVHATFTF